jgi:hypothetical protein
MLENLNLRVGTSTAALRLNTTPASLSCPTAARRVVGCFRMNERYCLSVISKASLQTILVDARAKLAILVSVN